MKRLILLTAAWLILGSAGSLFAQGVQTGTIRGTVTDQQDLAVPGVTVTATSPALQGPRSTVTDKEGLFALRALPPGEYEVKFELPGFATVTRTSNVLLGLTVDQNVSMRAAGVAETVQVTADTPPPISSPIVGANFKNEEINNLATPRSIQGIATLAPALNENSPNAGQLVINGAFASDNVFMVNGVDINDNLFANPQNLFIEDAIEETQVLTSGISAEYGRFTGGVINAITKSGGNFLNNNWTTRTPFEKCDPAVTLSSCTPSTHLDKLNRTYEGTFGGPIVRDRIWFFTSGRHSSTASQSTLNETGIVVPTTDVNKRAEIKITGTILNNHTLQGGWLNDPRKRTNNSGLQQFVIDSHSEVDRQNPNWYSFVNYRGVLKANALAEIQYSERRFEFKNDGGTNTDLIAGSPIFALSCGCVYNAPYFDATDPEQRNNKQFTGNMTNFWNGGGGHETKYGYEFYRSQRTGGNSQSPTSYVFNADYVLNAAGKPVLDSTGRPIPVFVPGESYIDYFPATRGAVMNTDNHSVFVQDHWTISPRWSADIGARFEQVNAVSTGDIKSVDAGRIVPRFALAYDVNGNGSHIWHVTYGQYSGRYNEALIGANSPVGNPATIESIYQGPAGQGYAFLPGFALANYPVNASNTSVSDPLQNIKVEDGMKSALVHEFSTSYGANLFNGRGFAEVSYVFRKTTSMIDDFQDKTTGKTNVQVLGVSAGTFTNILYKNTDLAHREYQGLVFQSRYRIRNNFSVNGHYTLQIKNEGNYEGEGSNTPGSTTWIGDFPEILPAARYYPDGVLQSFQRHRMRLWSIYNFGMGPFGDLSLSGLWRVEGERPYSLAARNVNITATQRALLTANGYPDGPGSGHVFFGGERGTERFPAYGVLDTSINYNIPVFRSLRPWLKFDVYNLFNNTKLIAWNTTVSQDGASPKDSVGLATGYIKSSSFGKATGNTLTNLSSTGIQTFPLAFSGAPQGGRTFRVAVGVRF
jgi:hypothetical protein